MGKDEIGSEPSPKPVRLPDSVDTFHYDVTLEPDFENFTFKGRVRTDLTIHKPVTEISLHAADLEVSDVHLWVDKGLGDGGYKPSEVQYDKDSETVTFKFNQVIPPGKGRLFIDYSGILSDKMVGFYRSKYTTPDGQTKYLATTQFEATDARRALPCFDEPARKATFDVRFIIPGGLVGLSNMPVTNCLENLHDRDGYKQLDFGTTPVMSTYLLAFIIGDLEYVEGFTKTGTRVRVYTVPGKKEQGRFALDVAIRTLEFYNEYFGIDYPLPKLDMVAIPDFAAGAMENWGLITYRENAVLIDPANSSAGARQRVAEVVAHELAHQWFGNLVTMEWWTNLWLNEGFATWISDLAVDHLFPEWDIWTQFVAGRYAGAMSLDGLRSTHPIEVPVGHPNEISQIFDAISYSKGASVIRMIHDFIGPEAFRKGLNIYLTRHAYGNAVTEDLWAALAEASGQPVREIMDTWTKQGGYPLLNVSTYGNDYFLVKQERFLASGEELTDSERAQQWKVPFVYGFHPEQGEPTMFRFAENLDGLSIQAPVTGDAYLKLNMGQVALLRVAYPDALFQPLVRAVKSGKLTPADRFGLVSDTLALARAGKVPTGQLLELLSAFKDEDNFTVWTAILGALGALENILEDTDLERPLQEFARNLLYPISRKLGWNAKENEPHTDRLLRGMVLSALGSYRDGGTAVRATERFDLHVSGIATLEPDLRAAVYGITAKVGVERDFKSMLELYEKETFQEEKVRLLSAMGKFSDPAITAQVIQYAVASGKVRPGDLFYVLSGLTSNAKGRRAAWEFLKTEWDAVSERYSGGGLKLLARIIELTCDSFSTFADADEIQAFFKEHPAPSATRAIAEALERIRVRAAWYGRDKDSIASVLTK